MFSSRRAESTELRIRRLRTECGCEACAYALLGAFVISSVLLSVLPHPELSTLARWLTASLVAVVAGVVAKFTAIVYARRQLRTLLAKEDHT